MQKILFLDIDGVLNSLDYYKRREDAQSWMNGGRPENEIDPQAVKVLNDIITATNALIVISSSWREIFTVDEIKQTITTATDNAYPKVVEAIIGETTHWVPMEERPTDWQVKNYQRGFEIADWLAHQEVMSNFWVGGYAILDDNSDMAWLSRHLILTKHDNGLLPEHVEKVIQVMNLKVEAGKYE